MQVKTRIEVSADQRADQILGYCAFLQPAYLEGLVHVLLAAALFWSVGLEQG